MSHFKLPTSFALVIPVILLGGCNRSPTDEQNKAFAAQREADDKIAAAHREAEQQTATAQKGADDKTARTTEEANKEAAQAQANANDVIRSASASILKTRDDIREWGQGKLNAFDNDIDGFKTKAQTAPPKAQQSFNAALADVEAKRSAVEGQLAMLDTRSAGELDQYKKSLEKQMDAFGNSVSHLRSTL